VHSLALEVWVQPMPLQEFCPLHDDDAVLQELVPLQELMPPHLIVPSASAAAATEPSANRAAAEAMRRARMIIWNSSASADAARMTRDAVNRKSSLGDEA
jgi:hypothetical protein